MQTVNTLWRVAGRRRFLLGGIAAALYIHAGCGKPITYERLPVGTGEDAGPTADGSNDGPSGTDGQGSAGAPGLAGMNGSGGAGTAGAPGTGGRGPGTGGSTGAGGATSGTGGSTGTGGATLGTGGATGTGGAGMGGRTGTGGATGTGGSGDLAQINFETSNQGWASLGAWTGVGPTMVQHFAGQSSFGGTLTYTPIAGGTIFELGVTFPQAPIPVAGNVVMFHVFLPASAMGRVTWIQPYIQDNAAAATHGFFGAFKQDFLVFGGWNDLSVALTTTTAPPLATFVPPVFKIAVQFHVDGAAVYSGAVYVDAISW